MAIKIKAVERNVAFEKGVEKWAYVLQADLYNKLSQAKVIQEASVRSGMNKGVLNAAWGVIGEVIKAWATEGHCVAVPGLGSMRFGIRSTSVANVNKVGTDLITSRRVIFTPSTDIKEELKKTSINITCYDRNGEIVKRVTSTDDSDIEDPEDDNPEGDDPNGGSGDQTPKYTITVKANNDAYGSVEGGGEYTENASATLKATAKNGYEFKQWNDGNTAATRVVTVVADKTYTATFSQKQSEEEGTI